MFGFLAALFVGGLAAKESWDNMSYNCDSKDRAIKEGRDYYYDHKMIKRDLKTGHPLVDRYDNDGYIVTVDYTNNKVIDNPQLREAEYYGQKDKERAIRAGHYTYSKWTPQGRKNFRVSDDKWVVYKSGYCEPYFGLLCDDRTDTDSLRREYIIRNRKQILLYCKQWYIEGGVTKETPKHPREIIDVCKEYGITVFQADVDYCLDLLETGKIADKELYSNFLTFDENYHHLEGVPKKYWIEFYYPEKDIGDWIYVRNNYRHYKVEGECKIIDFIDDGACKVTDAIVENKNGVSDTVDIGDCYHSLDRHSSSIKRYCSYY